MIASIDYKQKYSSVLEQVSKPGRYVGGEPNMIRKDPEGISVRFALAFPEIYEIGMSHNGLRILYHLLNRIPDVYAERVFAPWVDMAAVLQGARLPLVSLETHTPVCHFDILGFSLQAEVTYINVPYMLDLAAIPMLAESRGEADPLVCAGGPCTANPEPLADFMDFFVIGDGEEIIAEIVDFYREAKKSGLKRRETLEGLAKLEGIYVPSIHQPPKPWEAESRPGQPITLVKRRWVETLSPDFYPTRPIVPIIDAIQDRISIEVMRGCTQGCRFCQAGYWYRPTRELEVQDILRITAETLKNTGNREIGLLSLSTADYSQVERLTKDMARAFSGGRVSISLPSLRADAFSVSLAENVSEVKKNGFTFAPEAGSVRLRKFINKNISNDDLFQTIETAYRQGWNLVKLYFMIGLPTETDADIRELVDLIREVGRIGRKVKGGKNLNASIGTFVPKPFTPFQWDRFEDLRITTDRLNYLKSAVRFPFARLKWHNPQESFVEGVLCRGDRQVGRALLKAHQLGCRFDGWNEMFNFNLWMRAFDESGVDPTWYTRDIPLEQVLPWDFIDIGVSKKYLRKERERSYKDIQTHDCKWGECRGCGIPGNYADIRLASPAAPLSDDELARLSPGGEVVMAPIEEGHSQPDPAPDQLPAKPELPPAKIYILHYWKENAARFLSHLNVMKLMERAMLQAGLGLRFTQGFNPRPKIATSPAIPLGIASRSEYLQFEVHGDLPANLVERMNQCLMEGLVVQSIEPFEAKGKWSITRPLLARYRARLDDSALKASSAEWADLLARVNDFIRHLAGHRNGNGFMCQLEDHDLITDLAIVNDGPLEIGFTLSVNLESGVMLKPRDLLSQVLGFSLELTRQFLITKESVEFT